VALWTSSTSAALLFCVMSGRFACRDGHENNASVSSLICRIAAVAAVVSCSTSLCCRRMPWYFDRLQLTIIDCCKGLRSSSRRAL
jgi:hypothetical protein